MRILPALLFSVSAQVVALRASASSQLAAAPLDLVPGKPLPTVYFTSEITPDSLVEIFEALGVAPSATDNVAVKISTGEAGGHNYLQPSLISNLVSKVNGTIVECNTAYRGQRNTFEGHWKTIRDHGFTAIAKVELLDEHGEIEIPVRDTSHIKADLVGAGLTNYNFMINLAHFKGHQMGGFGGVLKNQSIGVASANGKARIHSAGATDSPDNLWSKLPSQDAFLESMAAAAQGVHDYFGGGRIVYINVLNNLSVDCDCSSHPAAPKMKDVGIMASLDPVALDRACVDLVMRIPVSDGDDNRDLLKRIESRHGTHIIDHAEKIGLGSQKYALVNLMQLKHPEFVSMDIAMSMESAIGMIRRGDAECIVMRRQQPGNRSLRYFDIAHGRGIAPLLNIYTSHEKWNNEAFAKLSVEEKLAKKAPAKPLDGCVLADKVIGRAAAFIAISGGVKSVYGEIMCEGAKRLLEENGIEVMSSLLVPQIRDRSYAHLCPLEDSVKDITDPEEAMKAIRARVAALKSGEKISTPELPPFPRKLVAYYSYSQEGNTRMAAEAIARAVGADIFEIKPFAPYPGDYKECLAAAKAEIAAGARPNLLPWPVAFGSYDTVYVGSPIWCGKIAPPVSTFLSVAELKGKKVVPFFTYGGGGVDKATLSFRAACAQAEAEHGAWKSAELKRRMPEIEAWAKSK